MGYPFSKRIPTATLSLIATVFVFTAAGTSLSCRADKNHGEPPPPVNQVDVLEYWSPGSNLLVITLDTTRADVLGCYGAQPSVTENIDRLARRSHFFERCSAPIPQTLPSHLSIFSGLYPHRHGVRKNFASGSVGDVPLVAEAFRKAGYATGAFVSAFVLDARFGLSRGFETYEPEKFSREGGVEAERPGDETVGDAIAWLSNQEKPWFAWVHLFDPHTPYDPPAPYSSRYPDNPYLGEVAFTDHQVGRLLDAIEDGSSTDRTAVVLCGDHGEGLGDHGEPTHGILLYESTTRVPLIIHTPGQTTPVRHSEPVNLVDLAPTMLSLINADIPGDGQSLRPYFVDEAPEPRTLLLESLEGFFRSGWSPIFGAIRDQWKYLHSPRPELYDLVADPDETHNIIDRHPEVVARLFADLEPIVTTTTPSHAAKPTLSAEEQQALMSLGYIDGAPGQSAGSRGNPADLIHLAAIHHEGLRSFRKGDLRKAAELFRRELAGDPGSPLVHWYLGRCLTRSNPSEASQLFRKAIELQPTFEEPYVELCELSLAAQRMDALAPIAERGIDASIDQWGTLHYFRALGTLATGGNINSALTDLATAIERSREPLRPLRLRALVHLRHRRDPDAALDDLEALVPLLTASELDLLRQDSTFQPLRGHRRFEALFERPSP